MKQKYIAGNPKVSICVFTYNHEKYLASALDSALSQVVNFEYEIVIGEDYSTDRTLIIAEEYRSRFPKLIRIVQSGCREKLKINGRATGRLNFLNVLQSCRAKYIALLDGDDYWISPRKLQIQFDFLEQHQEYSLVFHNVYLEEQSGGISDSTCKTYHARPLGNDEDLGSMLLTQNIVPTSAAMLRNHIPTRFPNVFYKVSIGDWPFQVFNLNFGKVHYIDEIMGVYRIGSGLWSEKSRIDQLLVIIDTYRFLPELTPSNMRPKLKTACIKYYQELVYRRLVERRFILAAVTILGMWAYMLIGRILLVHAK